jgi:hypothetical protein
MFNAVKPLSIVSKSTAENKLPVQETDSRGKVVYLE